MSLMTGVANRRGVWYIMAWAEVCPLGVAIMIRNPVDIENDVVLTYGRWCLDQCLYEINRHAIQIRADQRRADLIANRVVYCENVGR